MRCACTQFTVVLSCSMYLNSVRFWSRAWWSFYIFISYYLLNIYKFVWPSVWLLSRCCPFENITNYSFSSYFILLLLRISNKFSSKMSVLHLCESIGIGQLMNWESPVASIFCHKIKFHSIRFSSTILWCVHRTLNFSLIISLWWVIEHVFAIRVRMTNGDE